MVLVYYIDYFGDCYLSEAVVVVIVWYLDLQLPMQAFPITTKVVSSNPAEARLTRYYIK